MTFYSTYERRLATFSKWADLSNKQIGRDLARSGFIFEGVKDLSMCVFCGGRFSKFAATDDVHAKHVQFMPNCEFARAALEQEDKKKLDIPVHTLKTYLFCRICKEKESCVLMDPCNHIVSCQDCSGSLSKCPICSVVKKKCVNVFFS